jgi:hypothetical protein
MNAFYHAAAARRRDGAPGKRPLALLFTRKVFRIDMT